MVVTGTTTGVSAYSFSCNNLPGFNDYFGVYSHFRILKAVLQISRGNDPTAYDGSNYVIVPSRAFAASQDPWQENVGMGSNSGVPTVQENELRQTRWQKTLYPSTTRQVVRVGFFPYTLVGTFGPTRGVTTGATTNNPVYQRVWNARKWMPFTWSRSTATPATNLVFYGPYVFCQGEQSGGNRNATLTVYLQFKGQV